jgi:hypothetical protein
MRCWIDKGAFGLWTDLDRFMRDDAHCATTHTCIQNKPVAAGLCSYPLDWQWSSACVGSGMTG